jgi:hypothetical protein
MENGERQKFVYVGIVQDRSKHKFISRFDPSDVRILPISLNRLLKQIRRSFCGYIPESELNKLL